MVPMTILVTATATLVYLHSRFVERPADRPVDEHQIFALAQQVRRLHRVDLRDRGRLRGARVSDIRPIREMGIWVALGLAVAWVIVFTLFPALQKVLRDADRRRERRTAGAWFQRFADWLPARRTAGAGRSCSRALALSALGAVALFGFPGVVDADADPHRTRSSTSNPHSPLYHDIQRLAAADPGPVGHAGVAAGQARQRRPSPTC